MNGRDRSIKRSFLPLLLTGVLVAVISCYGGGEPSGISVAAAALTPPYVDDGRYDYRLSQPDPSYRVKVENNMDITMSDGTKLKGDVYRPDAPGRFPVIMAEAPYPRIPTGSPGTGVDDNGGAGTTYQGFEQPNPEYWIPRGYVYVTYNPRGYGGSEGQTSVLSLQEYRDNYDAIEWAAAQPWSDGNIGMFGISYYAFSQYSVAGLNPPSLKAIVPWEGLADPYRDIAYRGGIPCNFGNGFGLMMQSIANNPSTAVDYPAVMQQHPLYDEVWEYGVGFVADPESNDTPILDLLAEIDVPMLSVGNLNDPDLHLRGNQTAFMAARTSKKKLLLYSGTHWGSAYQPWANRTVLRFFDHWLKGIDTGIYNEPAVDVQLRTASDTFTHIYGDTWPLAQTQWTKYYLDAGDRSLSTSEPEATSSAVAEFKDEAGIGSSDQLSFSTASLEQDVAIAGPLSAHFWVSSSLEDVDLTVELRDFDANGNETRFPYYVAGDDLEPVTRGWLRASLRALDPERTTEHMPYYSFRKNEWLTPGIPVAVDVELWPTSILFKAGHRIALTIHCGPYTRSRDFLYQSVSPPSGTTEIHTGGEHSSWLDLPVIPADTATVHQIYINDGDFTPSVVTGEMGERFQWTNDGEDYHSSTESSGLHLWDSQLIRGSRSHNPETWWTDIDWAGTFNYRDMVAVWDFSGAIEIPVGVPELVKGGESATIVLGKTPPPDGTGFDVQLQKEGGKWRSIETGVSSTEITTDTLAEGTYAVRARLTSLDDTEVATDWSPEATFTVEPDDAGCGCRVVGLSNSTGRPPCQWLAGFLLLAFVFRRRMLWFS